MKVFLARDPLDVVRAKSESLVEPFGRRMVHLDQERHANGARASRTDRGFTLRISRQNSDVSGSVGMVHDVIGAFPDLTRAQVYQCLAYIEDRRRKSILW
jgi:hypothetical protein